MKRGVKGGGGGGGSLGFPVFRFWSFFRSIFRFSQKNPRFFGFGVFFGFRVNFPSISIWFSVSGKNTSGFSDLVLAVVFAKCLL